MEYIRNTLETYNITSKKNYLDLIPREITMIHADYLCLADLCFLTRTNQENRKNYPLLHECPLFLYRF